MSNITDYEFGNFALHRIAEPCYDLAKDSADSHPIEGKFFRALGAAICHYGQDMEGLTKDDPMKNWTAMKLKKRILKACLEFKSDNVQRTSTEKN